jgi:hypothetical protein
VRRRLLPLLAILLLLGLGAAAAGLARGDQEQQPPPPETTPQPPAPPPSFEPIRWRASAAVGRPWAGRLVRGVRLPSEGEDFFTWDPVLKRTPNRAWRRWGTDRLLRLLLRVLREHRAANPGAPRIGIGDLSRPRGGDFGPRYGSVGHASHQNGLDADVYYPRLDRAERRARHVREVDRALAQDLVDRFVEAGAVYVFVGPATGLTGPRRVVQRLRRHDDHLHIRIGR